MLAVHRLVAVSIFTSSHLQMLVGNSPGIIRRLAIVWLQMISVLFRKCGSVAKYIKSSSLRSFCYCCCHIDGVW